MWWTALYQIWWMTLSVDISYVTGSSVCTSLNFLLWCRLFSPSECPWWHKILCIICAESEFVRHLICVPLDVLLCTTLRKLDLFRIINILTERWIHLVIWHVRWQVIFLDHHSIARPIRYISVHPNFSDLLAFIVIWQCFIYTHNFFSGNFSKYFLAQWAEYRVGCLATILHFRI